jgi:hypothetical protein
MSTLAELQAALAAANAGMASLDSQYVDIYNRTKAVDPTAIDAEDQLNSLANERAALLAVATDYTSPAKAALDNLDPADKTAGFALWNPSVKAQVAAMSVTGPTIDAEIAAKNSSVQAVQGAAIGQEAPPDANPADARLSAGTQYTPSDSDPTGGAVGQEAPSSGSLFSSVVGLAGTALAATALVKGISSSGGVGTFLNQVAKGDKIKDWDHASKLFVADNYALMPKQAFLYHVFFDINQLAGPINGMNDSGNATEMGMMVKQCSLPKFTIDADTLNAYNRPHNVQKKIHYDPVNITFHDDSADRVRNFWYDYYKYYYRNSDVPTTSNLTRMNNVNKELINPRDIKDWGYTIRGSTTGDVKRERYLNAIKIYSLHNKQFSEYILINPMIKSFQHGEHNSSDGSGVMQHTMTVIYESVLYGYGKVSANSVMGFLNLHYDKRPSPLSVAGGGSQSITGQGGLLDAVSEISGDLANGNFGSAIFKGMRSASGLKGADLGGMIASEALSMGKQLITTGKNPFASINIPSAATLSAAGSAVSNKVSSIFTNTPPAYSPPSFPSNLPPAADGTGNDNSTRKGF